ncbi:MAG: DeoR/GlpR family DNA-binding transcription regulator [Cyclobacteriaceae bacterium]|nr:DeoR/GlpR transcriptional regulator [Cyclobacteriaceae bacterium]MCH8515685.1 DeoR/GlpR family DNA-binding transcription regulator [Cyclobacteriaceae bacterium]
MLKEERQLYIMDRVQIHNRVLLSDLSEALNVSIDTVRRDVNELSSLKKLKKVHGGAISNDFNSYNPLATTVFKQDKKRLIARKAIGLLKNGNVVLISGGTTNQELVKLIPHHLHLTVFTPSPIIAMLLMEHDNIEIILLGGKLSKAAKIAAGGQCITTLNEIRVDFSFIGSGHIHPEAGLTELDWEIIQVKKSMIQAAKHTVVLSISDKINSVQRYKTCDISRIKTIITELEPDNEILLPFQEAGINVL